MTQVNAQQANAKQALGSTMGAVVALTGTVGNVFDSLNRAVSMGNKYITEASIDQDDRALVHRDQYRRKLINESAVAETVQQKQILEFVSTDDNAAKMFAENHARLTSLFD